MKGNSEVARDLFWDVKFRCKIAGELTPATRVSSFTRSGKAPAQPCLGVAVLKRELCVCGEAGFAKYCIDRNQKRQLTDGSHLGAPVSIQAPSFNLMSKRGDITQVS
jgi:hypothetical protein